ncbi:sulfotransferase family protein [Azospirillum sp. TSO22-1]|uniref:sulfotransferase-like domain-containing protein n=1 Tax=Azospirillum sp. TSO22-1 TaxID=716789 RepID=UPI000D64F847|nr:sulfotransferase family protein [Azospirillum sp. TSO22-1]
MSGPIRIAMWSGPRNISTAMMRAWENRPDTAVVDEPFYAAYLAETGLDHPGREDVLASQPTDWRTVAAALVDEPVPGGRAIFYQKHMTHHMLPGVGLDWTDRVRNAFLIRDPAEVVASYVQRRGSVDLADIGVERQAELFDREADRLGRAPPVVDARDVLGAPATTLARLCDALGVPFTEAMLRWPPGRRATDGVWAPHWYASVEASTGFGAPPPQAPALSGDLLRVAEAARPTYERLHRWRLV